MRALPYVNRHKKNRCLAYRSAPGSTILIDICRSAWTFDSVYFHINFCHIVNLPRDKLLFVRSRCRIILIRKMPIQIRNSLNSVDRARFQIFAAAFESYITNHPRHQVQVGERNHERMEVVEFDEAEITYVMHPVMRVRLAHQIQKGLPFILQSVLRILIQALMSLSA